MQPNQNGFIVTVDRPWRVGGLLQPAEQDHRHVGAGDADQRGDAVDAGVQRDQHHHERRAERVLHPPEPVDAGAEVVAIGTPEGGGGQQVIQRGECAGTPHRAADREVEQRFG
jgi:hypothetical protein